MDQEMDDKSPISSRNNTQNTQNMVLEGETPIMTRNNTQQTDQDMDEALTNSRCNTQQTDQGMDENGENGENEENNEENNQEEIPHKKRRRNTKKKDDNETSAIINKPKRRAPTKGSNKSKKKTSQAESSNLSPTPENQVKTKKPSVIRNFWSLQDDKKLVDAVLANLQEVPWSKIARENFPNRERSGCYNRWNVLKKRLYQVDSMEVKND
ncbi:hypothetical protein C1645_736687 [Glomus cerebriforme]|uniref:Myb-like domain-containing protein n=1 Tax=Glomus cerebriforme TaxID=658196 RepID=A0A397T1H8_9GLOM|nr:hypothetical protein C1645_736687 [Glomus cerebriforme]